MAYMNCWLPLLFAIFILNKSDVASEQISELSGGIARERGLRRGNELLAAICNACRDLLQAAQSGDVNTVKILFKYTNEKCTTDDEYRNTPLIVAAGSGRLEVVRVLLECGADTERRNAYQRTALHEAAWFGHLDVCSLLLQWGAKVDSRDLWAETPLHDAARKRYLSVVKLLVERGADVRLKNADGQTARKLARNSGRKDVAKWLDPVRRG